jgi:hypothetical protein
MGKWVSGFWAKVALTGKSKNGKLPLEINLAKDGIFDIPIFHRSLAQTGIIGSVD